MTDQHRASPADWLLHAASLDDADSSCILELRARIEALEATQHAHADVSRLSDAEREQVTQELAKPVRVFTAKEVAPIVAPATRVRFISEVFQAASAEARPAGLVERDPECVANWPDCYEGGYDPSCCRFPKSCSCEVRRPLPGPDNSSAGLTSSPGSLVERVAYAMGPQSQAAMDAGELPHGAARAAIREVAAWLRENDSECQMGGDAAATAELLEQEASHG